MAEWSIAAVLKTVELQGSGGSNPSLSAAGTLAAAPFPEIRKRPEFSGRFFHAPFFLLRHRPSCSAYRINFFVGGERNYVASLRDPFFSLICKRQRTKSTTGVFAKRKEFRENIPDSFLFTKNIALEKAMFSFAVVCCGEKGIRTPETLLTFTRFPGGPVQPLLHLSFAGPKVGKLSQICKSAGL